MLVFLKFGRVKQCFLAEKYERRQPNKQATQCQTRHNWTAASRCVRSAVLTSSRLRDIVSCR